jgi:hypothetical protein
MLDVHLNARDQGDVFMAAELVTVETVKGTFSQRALTFAMAKKRYLGLLQTLDVMTDDAIAAAEGQKPDEFDHIDRASREVEAQANEARDNMLSAARALRAAYPEAVLLPEVAAYRTEVRPKWRQ